MTKVVIVADRHCAKLVLSIPLKSAAHHFTLYKIITLPKQVGTDKFIRYTVDYPYLAMQVGLRDYTLLSEVEYQQCTKGNPAVCPANRVIYSTQRLTCEISLYFQTVAQYHLCKRELMLQHQAPTMLQHDAAWVYYFPTPQRVTVLCPRAQDLSPHTELLMGSGLLRNATTCHVSTSDMQILPTLRGSMRGELEAPRLYFSSKTPIPAEHEARQLEQITPSLIRRLNDIQLSAMQSHRTLDLETLFSMQDISAADRQQPQYYAIIALGATAFTAIGILFLYAKPHILKMCDAPPDPEDVPITQEKTAEQETAAREPAVTFAAYTLQEHS
jgi:hypothetical protein